MLIYVTLCTGTPRYGDYIPETPLSATTKQAVIADICDGQNESVDRVIEVNTDMGTSADVTGDIAREIYFRLDAECEGCPSFLRNWIDRHYRAGAADELDRGRERSDYEEHSTISRAYQGV